MNRHNLTPLRAGWSQNGRDCNQQRLYDPAEQGAPANWRNVVRRRGVGPLFRGLMPVLSPDVTSNRLREGWSQQGGAHNPVIPSFAHAG